MVGLKWQSILAGGLLNAGGSKLSDVLKDAKFCSFWPLWKLGEGRRDLYQLLKLTYDRTSEIHLIAIYCVVAEHGGLIKKETWKESSWVKLKAFPTNVGRPNNTYLCYTTAMPAFG